MLLRRNLIKIIYILIISNYIYGNNTPIAITNSPSIEVGPGPNAVRLRKDEKFVLNCTIKHVESFDIVTNVKWTFENELDEVFKVEMLDNDHIQYDKYTGVTTYEFGHHPTSADAGLYNCTFYDKNGELAETTIRLTCDPVPKEGARKWKGLKEDDPFRRDYKHVPSITIYPGDDATMQCRATAYPRPRFQWFRIEQGIEDDDVIGTAHKKYIIDRKLTPANDDDDDHVIADGDVLRIKNARFEDRGYYCCTANNSDDYSLNLYFMVRVKDRYSFIWPLICLGVIVLLLISCIGIGEHLRKKNEAKFERLEQLAKEKQERQPSTNAPLLETQGLDMKLRYKPNKNEKTEVEE